VQLVLDGDGGGEAAEVAAEDQDLLAGHGALLLGGCTSTLAPPALLGNRSVGPASGGPDGLEQMFVRMLDLFEQVLYRRTHVRSNA
jgi:hypothetical protein